MTKERAARAGAWSAVDLILRQGIQFVVSIILARLLAPEDFGLIALLTFFSSLSIVFVQGGLSMALVQRQETTSEQESAVFWCNLGAGIIFALILVAIGPFVARFYGYPALEGLMLVAAAQVVLSALGAVQTALLTRTLRFDQLTKTGVVSSILSGACGIAAALEGWGAWALGVQLLVMAAASTIALWWVSDWRPIFRFRFKSIRDLLSFGVHISMSSVLELVYSNGFILVIGKFYGARDVGYLTRATAIHTLPTGIISAIIGRTALPLFAARANDLEASLRAFRMSVRLAMLLSLPLMAGLAVLADLIILVLIGPKWLPAAPVLAIGAIGGALLPLHVLNLQLLLARGASKQFLKLELQKKACGLICFGIGCFYGIIGIAYASLVFQALAFYINSQPTKSDFAYGPVRQLVEVREPLLATAFMSAGVFALRQLVDLPPVPLLVSLVVSGGLLYLCFGFLLRMSSFKEGLELLTTVFAGERTTRALSYLRSRFIRTP